MGKARSDARHTGRGALLTTARAALDAGGSVLLTGEPGIGRSTVLAALAAERPGTLVLRCAPAEADRHLPLLGLIDLLSEVDDAAFAVLPPDERAVLRTALHRPGAGGEAGRAAYRSPHADVLALRIALLGALAALCERSPSCSRWTTPSGSTARAPRRWPSQPGVPGGCRSPRRWPGAPRTTRRSRWAVRRCAPGAYWPWTYRR
ncbi:ATP-binding protein [Actinacidiphila bryophytorum]|uniref:ATP-binding protein n=1 Tax=Actinacidiphila bryophytorum TaxID=1436133 RepID=UPI002176C971|nr:ATP-binding protein [Actinacidiphila bryophytorum]UWE11150.1 ATP-binding protein [Actinacidiphila bryophytorum]